MRGARGQGSAIGLATVLLACEPRYSVEYETEHLRVAKSFDAPICGGTLRAMELDAARIAEQLGGQEHAPVDVVLGVEAVAAHCPANSSGCASPGGPVHAEFRSFGHELVHAFAGEHTSIEFIEEGLAEALGAGMTHARRFVAETQNVSIAEAILGQIHGDPAAYELAGHFVTWLIDRWGLDAVLRVRASLIPGATLPAISSSFEATFGVSLESAELAWQTTAPNTYEIGKDRCEGPSEAWLDDRRWAGRLELDCDAETTFGPLGHSNAVEAGMQGSALVDVLQHGDYQLSVTATRAGTIEIDSHTCGCSFGLATRERYELRAGSQTFYPKLMACRYRVSYIVSGVEPASAEIVLELLESSGPW
jgi:hypothetical protein